MRRGKNTKSIGQFIIDLTPLLDVVFIVLIVVLCSQVKYNADAEDKLNKAKGIEEKSNSEIAEKDAELNSLRGQLETYDGVNEFVNIVTVFASYDQSDPKQRTLYVNVNTSSSWENPINPSNDRMDGVWADCEKYILSHLDDMNKPVIFSISNDSDGKILYRDEQSILSLYEGIDLPNKLLKNYSAETE